jgi:hypothetical protein
MRQPEKQPKPTTPSPALPAEIPEDVRAELELESPEAVTATPPAPPAEPIPEDVLAERDAEVRAVREEAVNPELRPVELDEDSEY